MEEAILCIVLLVLSIGLTLFALLKKPFSLYGIDYIFAIIGVLILFYSLFFVNNCKIIVSKEEFVNSIEGVLDLLGSQDKKTSKNLAENIKNNEDINSFSRNLTIYYSAFSKISYPHNTKRWLNISPYFSSPQNICPDIKIQDTNAEFSDIPSYSPDNGFALGLNKITGPMSHQLGINANDSFSIFFSMSFNEFLQNEPNDLILLKLYANTETNNGLSMVINKDYTIQSNGTVLLNGTLSFGNQTETLAIPQITPEYIYLFVIIKQGHNLIINMYPNVGDLSSTYSRYSTLGTFQVNGDVLLSNKEMIINNNKNLQAHIFNFGIYNKAITTQTISAIYTNLQTQIQKYSQVLQDLNSAISKLNKKIEDIKKCPYDDNVCKTCNNIKDWTNMTNIILNASPECLSAINEYCSKNPGKEICSCWNPSNVLSQTSACKSYTSIFNGGKCITPDNLDSNTLDIIKSKYKFCNCVDIEKSKITPVVVPKPKIINQSFNVNSTDIDLYNSLPIHGKGILNNPWTYTGGRVPQN